MKSDDIITGIVFGSIVVAGLIVCFFGYLKMNGIPLSIIKQKASNSQQEGVALGSDADNQRGTIDYTKQQKTQKSGLEMNSRDSVGNTTIADFAHINVSAEQLLQALKYNYDSLAQDATDEVLDSPMLDFRYSHTAPVLKYDSSGETTPMSGYESKVYNIYMYVFSRGDYYDTGFLFSIAVDEQNNVKACSLTYPNSYSYDTQIGYDIMIMSLALVNSIAPETIGNDNIGANIAMDAFDYGEQYDKQIQTGDYIYSGNVFVPFFIAQTKEIYLAKWGESTYKTMVIDLSNQNNRNKTPETFENRNVREDESNKSMDASGLNSYSYAENLDDLLQNNQPIQH